MLHLPQQPQEQTLRKKQSRVRTHCLPAFKHFQVRWCDLSSQWALQHLFQRFFSSLSLPLYKPFDTESHLRSTTTGQHRLSEELVPLGFLGINIVLSSSILHACITRPRKKSFPLYFSPDLSVL